MVKRVFLWLTAVFLFSLSLSAKDGLPDLDRRRATPNIANPIQESQLQALNLLRERVSHVKVDWEPRFGSPAWIAARDGFLTGHDGEGKAVTQAFRARQANNDPHRGVKAFVDEHSGLFGHNSHALGKARVKRDYVTAHSGIHTTVWQQEQAGIEVYEAVFQAHSTKKGELINVASRFLPDAVNPNPAAMAPTPRIDAIQAMIAACTNVDVEVPSTARFNPQEDAVEEERRQFFHGDLLKGEARVRLVWLPTDNAVLRLTWEVIFVPRGQKEMFMTLVDAEDGSVWLRRSLSSDISDASYRIFTGESPTPFSPGYSSPGQTNQPAAVSRTLVTWKALDTNASPSGWINDGVNETIGNNVDAHTDLDDDDVADLPRPAGSPSRVFDFALDLNQAPSGSSYRKAAVTSLFYWCNWIHDRFYQLGFTESAGNFQQNNFGKGGLGGDRVLADAQDGGGTDNANFATPLDGMSGRMQMYLWPGPNPDRDGDFDTQIIIHEYAHGLSCRLVGGGVGISSSSKQAAGMGEGWSDFYAIALLSSAGENPAGTYAMGAYALLDWTLYGKQFDARGDNYYFGIRRYPYSTDMTKNPQTFKDIDPTQISSHPGVPTSPQLLGSSASEVHNVGEIWCAMLWEMRANLIAKHGFAIGNNMALELVTDGMKLSPANPTFVQARDAILQAELALTGGANKNEIWAAFAKRGLGAEAYAPHHSTTFNVVEDFSLPDTITVSPITLVKIFAPYGGPFSSWVNTNYVLSNTTPSSIGWTATAKPPLQVSLGSGSLSGYAKITNTISLNAAAAALLPVGDNIRKVVFSNTVSHLVHTRTFVFSVSEPLFFQPDAFTDYETLSGPQGGPFQSLWDPGLLTNRSNLSMQWTILPTPGVTFTPSSGTLPGHGSVILTQTAGPGAQFLPIGSYTNTIVISNKTTTGVQTRDGVLRVKNDTYLTQFFSSSYGSDEVFDLLNTRLTFVPDGTPTGYTVCKESAFAFPVNPAGGTQILKNAYGYDDFQSITLSGGKKIKLYGFSTNTVFVNFNGSITIGKGDDAYDPQHFDLRRISPLLGDNDEYATEDIGGSISWKQTADALVVTWQNVVNTRVLSESTNSFQAELFFDGTIRFTYQKGTEQYATAGLSRGTDYPPDFISTDFSAKPSCDSVYTPIVVTVPASGTEGVSLPANVGKVSVQSPAAGSLTVFLSSSDTSEITVPASVIIPAGATSAFFNITVVNDAILDGTQGAIITATASFHDPGNASISVHDNESTTLHLSLPASPAEGGPFVTGMVSTEAPVADDVIVIFNSPTSPAEVSFTFLPIALIQSGQSSANFQFTAYDDNRIDGTKPATIVATVSNWISATQSVNVIDNESTNLTVVGPLFFGEGQGGYLSNAAQVRISGTLPTNLTVNVTTLGGAFFEYVAFGPATIPAGQTNASFDLGILDDSQLESLESFQIVASAPGFGDGSWTTLVFDNDGPPPVLDPHPPHLAEDVSRNVDLSWARSEGELLTNGGFETSNLAGWTRVDSGGGGWISAFEFYDPPGAEPSQTPLAGLRYGLSTQYGNGRHEIYQDVTIPDGISAVTLSWSQRVRNHAAVWATNQAFRVELRDTANHVLTNLFVSQPGQTLLGDWTNLTFNLLAWRGETVRLAFVEIDELGSLNVALDNVSIMATPPAPTTWQVYFGTDSTPDATEFLGTTTNSSWALATLTTNTTYYWQIKSVRGGYTNTGPVWQFTTVDTLNQPPTINLRNPGIYSLHEYPASISFSPSAVIDDGIISKVEWWADDAKLGEDTVSPYEFTWTNAVLGEHSVWAVAQDTMAARGTSTVIRVSVVPSSGVLQTLVPFGSTWNFLDTGANLGNSWRSNSYRPSVGWKIGPGQFGYGEGDEKTVVDYGEDPADKHITTYFRHTFVPPSDLQLLQMRVLRDDGVAVYLNGREMLRNSLAAGAGYQTLASADIHGANEGLLLATNFSGTNVTARANNLLAAEIHQSAASSVDLSFDLELTGIVNLPPSVSLLSPVNNLLFVSPTNITLSANAVDPYGTVTNVQFTANGTILGNDSTPPYSFIWSNAPAGTHLLRAIVSDDAGSTNLSSTVTMFVIGPPPTPELILGTNTLIFQWPAASAGYRAESTTNLTEPVQWEPVPESPTLQGNTLRLIVPMDPQQRFFRLVAP